MIIIYIYRERILLCALFIDLQIQKKIEKTYRRPTKAEPGRGSRPPISRRATNLSPIPTQPAPSYPAWPKNPTG